MTIQPGSLTSASPVDDMGRALAGASAAPLAVAAAHQAAQNLFIQSVTQAILGAWGTMPVRDLSRGWQTVGPRIFGYLSAAQEILASEAPSYIKRVLEVQDIDIAPPAIVPSAFAGIASDGRSLEGLLVGAIVSAKDRSARGGSPDEVLASGASYLTSATRTELVDAGTTADQVGLIVAQRESASTASAKSGTIETTEGRRIRYGWIRMLQPPSCGRCAMLAGKFYKWNDGFERHINCDCRHIPVAESLSSDLRVNPQHYFDSLSRKRQNDYFGVANSNAIRAGADIQQVMNAALRKGGLYTVGKRRYTREGTTRRGFYRQMTVAGRAKQKRPTPYQIMKDARGDQEAAVRLLKQFGYVIG